MKATNKAIATVLVTARGNWTTETKHDNGGFATRTYNGAGEWFINLWTKCQQEAIQNHLKAIQEQ